MYAYLDDLTVTGETIEHDRNLKRLLDAAATCNLTFNEDKSKNRMTSLTMLGYLVSYQNLKPDPERLQALFEGKTNGKRECLSTTIRRYG